MIKVDDKWFKSQGWDKNVYETSEETGRSGSYKRVATVWTKFVENGSHARHEHVVITYYRGSDKVVGRDNFYAFNAWGKNGFCVENRISHRRFTDEQVLAALKVCGIE